MQSLLAKHYARAQDYNPGTRYAGGVARKIDPDTGLQLDEGPSRNQYITASARHYFSAGLLQASVSKADARDLSDGKPVPEAPRLIVDVLGTFDRLPFHLRGLNSSKWAASRWATDS